jgi:hypothetical protein
MPMSADAKVAWQDSACMGGLVCRVQCLLHFGTCALHPGLMTGMPHLHTTQAVPGVLVH